MSGTSARGHTWSPIRLLLVVALANLAPTAWAQPEISWASFSSHRWPGYPAGMSTMAIVDHDAGYSVLMSNNEMYRRALGDSTWQVVCLYAFCAADVMEAHGSVVVKGVWSGAGSEDRSVDGGDTWESEILPVGLTALHWDSWQGSSTTLYAASGYTLYRSTQLGAAGTFEQLGALGGLTTAIATMPPSELLPGGRVLAAVWNGLTFSDDGGVTFQASNTYQGGGIIGQSISVFRDANHPFGAVAYASLVFGNPPSAALLRSDDGGRTWEETSRIVPGQFGIDRASDVYVLAASDGSVWYGVLGSAGGGPGKGAILRSDDGGYTVKEVGVGFPRVRVRKLVEAPDGRIFAATDSLVWYTTQPAIVVSNAAETPSTYTLDLRIEPNPAAGSVAVRWRQPEAGSARVTVLDALGREVLVVAEGERTAGPQYETLDTSPLPPGVYVARLTIGAHVSTARLVVAR